MTYLPKSELVGVLAPSSINPRDAGKNWFDIGAIITPNFFTYLGNGIVIAGNGAGRIFRSTDYGRLWTDTGLINLAGTFTCATYLGNGIVLVGDSVGHIWRNTNFGDNGTSTSPTGEWVDEGAIAGVISINTISYLGNGIVIFGTNDNHIFRNTNFGIAPWTNLGVITASGINISAYLENGIALVATSTRVWRSTNFGAAWTDLGAGGPVGLRKFIYLGNGIVIATGVGAINQIFRSNDFGLTWSFLPIFVTTMRCGEYLGNGIVIVGGTNGHIFRSTDYGLTFIDVATISVNPINISVYLDNGIVVVVDSAGEFFRSDVSYKINESQANYPRIPTADLGPGGSALRAVNTTYTNFDQTRSLMLIVTISCFGGGFGGNALARLVTDTANPPITFMSDVGFQPGLVGESNVFVLIGIIRPQFNYRINSVLGGSGNIAIGTWIETYI